MAKSITNIKRLEISKEEQQERDLQEVREAVTENKEAILKGIELLSALDEVGTLDTAYAFSHSKKKALKYVVDEISKDQYAQLLENLPEIVFMLGDLDVKTVRETTNRLNEGIKEMNDTAVDQKTTIFDLAKALKDPEINRSITMMMQFLKGMGRQ
ncbi:hypothetical protein GCM10010954_09280 [Halobacillus andaensis]|uniref:DUF1641 domain-containing protein n=1 Tax=Halobacillus andaensis TaxID=1176239 RepID=A0A917B173_HALAA|nr:DUF1641 domain-containing protein [Halobacillus andaensis]MBP2003718.1 uncharacterized protein YjgD (DUF1641 family) [Halobacillus andaensis]GGF12672.1 hypothetical protein GCM10010954_09280 [Halobacillus andaensis]